MKVKEILRNKPAKVITITGDQSLLDAGKLLTEYNIGAVIVVDDNGEPVGILSERDIVRKLADLKEDALNLQVQDAMTRDIIIGVPDDDLSHVSGIMTNRRIRHLPIIDGKKLVGMVSIGDVVKAQLDHVEVEAHVLRQYITGSYS
jgi:CBS domain-containing protein